MSVASYLDRLSNDQIRVALVLQEWTPDSAWCIATPEQIAEKCALSVHAAAGALWRLVGLHAVTAIKTVSGHAYRLDLSALDLIQPAKRRAHPERLSDQFELPGCSGFLKVEQVGRRKIEIATLSLRKVRKLRDGMKKGFTEQRNRLDRLVKKLERYEGELGDTVTFLQIAPLERRRIDAKRDQLLLDLQRRAG